METFLYLKNFEMIFLGLGVLLLSLLLRENAWSHTGTAHIYTLTVQFVEITLVLPLLPPPPSAAALLSLNPAKKVPKGQTTDSDILIITLHLKNIYIYIYHPFISQAKVNINLIQFNT